MHDNNSYTILLVEDDPVDRDFVSGLIFERLPETLLLYARSYEEAKQKIKEYNHVIDACLLDLTLPDLSGEELMLKMVNSCGFIPLIVLTRSQNVMRGVSAISNGVSDLLLKDEINSLLLNKSILFSIERSLISRKLHESEQRYASLFLHSPHSQWIFDVKDRQITKSNKTATLKYGFSEKEFKSFRIDQLQPPQLYEQAFNLISQPMDQNSVSYLGRFRHLTKNGGVLFVEMYASPLVINNRELRLIMAVDLTDSLRMEEMVRQAILDAQEKERYEIGAELHDNVKQLIAAGKLALEYYSDSRAINDPLLNKAKELIDKGIDEIRVISHRMAPSIIVGNDFKCLINKYIEGYKILWKKMDIRFEQNIQLVELTSDQQLNLYRITQEQIGNIVKHAGATVVKIELRKRKGKLLYEISDNGKGFNIDDLPGQRGIGLSNIERRAKSIGAEVSIISNQGKGCCVRILIG